MQITLHVHAGVTEDQARKQCVGTCFGAGEPVLAGARGALASPSSLKALAS